MICADTVRLSHRSCGNASMGQSSIGDHVGVLFDRAAASNAATFIEVKALAFAS